MYILIDMIFFFLESLLLNIYQYTSDFNYWNL